MVPPCLKANAPDWERFRLSESGSGKAVSDGVSASRCFAARRSPSCQGGDCSPALHQTQCGAYLPRWGGTGECQRKKLQAPSKNQVSFIRDQRYRRLQLLLGGRAYPRAGSGTLPRQHVRRRQISGRFGKHPLYLNTSLHRSSTVPR